MHSYVLPGGIPGARQLKPSSLGGKRRQMNHEFVAPTLLTLSPIKRFTQVSVCTRCFCLAFNSQFFKFSVEFRPYSPGLWRFWAMKFIYCSKYNIQNLKRFLPHYTEPVARFINYREKNCSTDRYICQQINQSKKSAFSSPVFLQSYDGRTRKYMSISHF